MIVLILGFIMKKIILIVFTIILAQTCFSNDWVYDSTVFISREKVHFTPQIQGGINWIDYMNINDETGIGIAVIETSEKYLFYHTQDNGLKWDSLNEFSINDNFILNQSFPPNLRDIKVNSLGNFLITTAPYTVFGEERPSDSATVFYSGDSGKTIKYDIISKSNNELYGSNSIILINDEFYFKANTRNIDDVDSSFWYKSDKYLSDFQLHSVLKGDSILGTNYSYYYSDNEILEMLFFPKEIENKYKLAKFNLGTKERDIIYEYKDRFLSLVVSEDIIFNVLIENTKVQDSIINQAYIVKTDDSGINWDTVYDDKRIHWHGSNPPHAYLYGYTFSENIVCFWSGSLTGRMLITLDGGNNWYHFSDKVPLYSKLEVFDTTRAYMYGGLGRKEFLIWEIFPDIINSIKEQPKENALAVLYPNPIDRDNLANVILPNGYFNKLEYKIISVDGTVFKNELIEGHSGNLRLNINGLTSGMYIIQIIADGINFQPLKMIIK